MINFLIPTGRGSVLRARRSGVQRDPGERGDRGVDGSADAARRTSARHRRGTFATTTAATTAATTATAGIIKLHFLRGHLPI